MLTHAPVLLQDLFNWPIALLKLLMTVRDKAGLHVLHPAKADEVATEARIAVRPHPHINATIEPYRRAN